MSRSLPYGKTQIIFRTLFILSTLLSLMLIFLTMNRMEASPQEPAAGVEMSFLEEVAARGNLTLLASCTTSIVSLVGFVSTLVLGWRKETRDAKTSELERKKLELELEKQRIELGKLKADEERKQKSEP
jgi:hypothetical protein